MTTVLNNRLPNYLMLVIHRVVVIGREIIINMSQLNERINVEAKESHKNEDGELVTVWVVKGSCWYHVQTRKLYDVKISAGTAYEDAVHFVVRFDLPFNVTKGMRIIWKKEKYEVFKVNLDTGNKEFSLIIAKQY